MALHTAIRDAEIEAPVVDYSENYWSNSGEPLARVTYAELRSGSIEINGKKIRTAGMSSYFKARKIALALKGWIEAGDFLLGKPVDALPGPNTNVSPSLLEIRPPKRLSKVPELA
jgi:uncharacterized protein (DUF39 family)